MGIKCDIVEGNKLCIVVDISPEALKNATKSKSAIAKALAKGQAADTVPASVVASSGGFTLCGPVKLSLNVIKA